MLKKFFVLFFLAALVACQSVKTTSSGSVGVERKQRMFRGLTSLTASEPNRTLLIVGHADATGADDHNMQVTLERSAVVSAYLRNDVDAFYAFYGPGTATKAWGAGEDQLMLRRSPSARSRTSRSGRTAA